MKSKYLRTSNRQVARFAAGTERLASRCLMNSFKKAVSSSLVHMPISVSEFSLIKLNIVSTLASSSDSPSLALPSSKLTLNTSYDSAVAKNALKHTFG